MTKVVVIRPQPGCHASVAEARALGLAAYGFPLFAIETCDWDVPDPAEFDALLIGSANALRHAGEGLGALRALPVYAVGEATAQAARDAGFAVTLTGSGGLQSVLEHLDPGHKRLLRLAGRERVELAPPTGVSIVERVVYASVAQPLPDELVDMLCDAPVVLLHSAEAARHFARQCDEAGIPRSAVTLATLGPRIVEAAGIGWRGVRMAKIPQDRALLALAKDLCQ